VTANVIDDDSRGRFHDRGQLAWEHYQRTASSVPASAVLAKLQTKLNAKRKRLGK
jgi:hypothetical protein